MEQSMVGSCKTAVGSGLASLLLQKANNWGGSLQGRGISLPWAN